MKLPVAQTIPYCATVFYIIGKIKGTGMIVDLKYALGQLKGLQKPGQTVEMQKDRVQRAIDAIERAYDDANRILTAIYEEEADVQEETAEKYGREDLWNALGDFADDSTT